MLWGLSQGGGLGSPTTVELSGNGSVFRVSDLALIGDGSGAELLASRVHTQQINSFDIGSTGALSGQTQAISALAAPVTQIATITIGARDFLITGTRDAPGMPYPYIGLVHSAGTPAPSTIYMSICVYISLCSYI